MSKIEFVCKCGKVRMFYPSVKKSRKTLLCRKCSYKLRCTHGMSKSAEFKAWASMIERCESRSSRVWDSYGGRGITVCKKWRKSFCSFYGDIGKRPSKNHSIDRINNNKGYEPNNCRWATKWVQASNRRCNTKTVGVSQRFNGYRASIRRDGNKLEKHNSSFDNVYIWRLFIEEFYRTEGYI